MVLLTSTEEEDDFENALLLALCQSVHKKEGATVMHEILQVLICTCPLVWLYLNIHFTKAFHAMSTTYCAKDEL